MTDASDDPAGEPPGEPSDSADSVDDSGPADAPDSVDASGSRGAGSADGDGDRLSRGDIEERYDFEDFGPRDMAEMSYEEWEAAFDPDSWITGPRLLDRVEADLQNRVANRDVFAVLERIERDGEPQLLAYSDEGYAVVYPDGSVEGSGTVLRDVKPSVALASMDSYEVPDPPEGDALPDPAEVPEGSGELGNRLMQIIGAVHLLAGVALLVAWVALALPLVAAVAAVGFLLFGVFVFLLVANARLSDRFRAEEYRNRLRAVGIDDEERPEFLPDGEDGPESDEDDDFPDEDDDLASDDSKRPSEGPTDAVSTPSERGE
ncbi:DUF7319 domain-containing protein [Halorussus litoreus]|uniref:DUF7319 domain-containing protein n=1 Tax=Halorussus litoreus TaxID=1710536 RepID=UPI001E47CF00|nr:hypothetical protein [Halorussus litoreus]